MSDAPPGFSEEQWNRITGQSGDSGGSPEGWDQSHPNYDPALDLNNDGFVSTSEANRILEETNPGSAVSDTAGDVYDGAADTVSGVTDWAGEVAGLARYWKYGLVLGLIAVLGYILRPLFSLGANATEGGA
jgi:hypothetical protein